MAVQEEEKVKLFAAAKKDAPSVAAQEEEDVFPMVAQEEEVVLLVVANEEVTLPAATKENAFLSATCPAVSPPHAASLLLPSPRAAPFR